MTIVLLSVEDLATLESFQSTWSNLCCPPVLKSIVHWLKASMNINGFLPDINSKTVSKWRDLKLLKTYGASQHICGQEKAKSLAVLLGCWLWGYEGGDIPPTRAPSVLLPKAEVRLFTLIKHPFSSAGREGKVPALQTEEKSCLTDLSRNII